MTIVHANRLRPFRHERSRFNKSIPTQECANDTTVSATPPNVVAPNDEWFAIDRLSRKRYIGGQPYYYVHWKDADQSKSWELVEMITPVAVAAFEQLLRQRRVKKRKRKNQLSARSYFCRIVRTVCSTCASYDTWSAVWSMIVTEMKRAVLKVVEERSRDFTLNPRRVPLPRNFSFRFLIWKWWVVVHSGWYFMWLRATRE